MLWDFGESIEWKQGSFWKLSDSNLEIIQTLVHCYLFQKEIRADLTQILVDLISNFKKSNRYSRIIKNRRFPKQ